METLGEPKLVNTWKPVTSEWQGADTPAVEVKGTPELESQLTQAAACKLRSRDARTPLLIMVYAGYCFLRSALLLAGLWMVVYAPDSEATKSIYAVMVPTIERISLPEPLVQRMQAPESSFEQQQADAARERAVRAIPGVFLLLSIPYAVSGVMWLLRSKNARMWTMWSAGFSAASGAMNWFFARYTYSDLAPLSGHSNRVDLVLPGILLNLFICLYLAYSPSVIEAFRDGED